MELEGHARQVAAARRGAFEQPEDLGRAGAGVRIEIGAEQAVAAGDVDLADGVEIESVDEAVGVEAEIDGVDMEVVQVEQQAAAGPPDQRVHEVLLAHVRSRHGRVHHAVLEQQPRAQDVLRPGDALAEHVEQVAVPGERQRQPRMMVGCHLGLHAHRRQMLADPGEAVAPVPFGELAHVVDVECRAAGDRQADAVRDQRVALGELVEDGDLVGQGGEPPGAIAAEILPEPLRYDRQELDRIGLGAQEIGQRAVEQQSNAGMTGSRAFDPGMPDLGMVELGMHVSRLRGASWWRGRS